MPRKKAPDPEALLTHHISLRVTAAAFQKLDQKLKESDCSTIGELARHIVSDRPIKCRYIDQSLNPVMEELALIRKELRAIGININQLTKRFHQDRYGGQRRDLAWEVGLQYQQVGERVERL